jgi:hypothetical protein
LNSIGGMPELYVRGRPLAGYRPLHLYDVDLSPLNITGDPKQLVSVLMASSEAHCRSLAVPKCRSVSRLGSCDDAALICVRCKMRSCNVFLSLNLSHTRKLDEIREDAKDSRS